MEQNKKLSLKEEMEKEARKIEQEILSNPNLEDVKVSDELETALFEKIQSYEKKRAMEHIEGSGTEKNATEEFSGELTADMPNFSGRTNDGNVVHLSKEDLEALRLGREILKKKSEEVEQFEVNTDYHKHLNSDKDRMEGRNSTGERAKVFRMPRKRRVIVAFVAVCVLVVATGVTSVGSKSYWKELLDGFLGNQSRQTINVKDMETQDTVDGEELSAYRDIREKLKIMPIRLGYRPESMKLGKVSIDIEQRRALLFYEYNGEIMRLAIYENDSDSSLGQKEEDELIDTIEVDALDQTIIIEEYGKKDTKRYLANFVFNDVHYQLKGVMDRDEFTNIIKNLVYFD